MQQNYTQLLERISRTSGLSIGDLERKIEAKRAKLSGLISKEGAAQIVASELGINFDKEKIKISEMMSGMKKANVTGKIIQMFPIREYNKNNRQGKIGVFIFSDETSSIRTVLWDTNHIDLIEQGKIKEGDVVDITNASVRNSELHLTGFSDIKLSNEVLENVVEKLVVQERNILDLKIGNNVKIRALVVQIFEPRFFTVCPVCSKKVSEIGECKEHEKVAGERRALLNLVLDDGSETIRTVLFSEQIELLGIKKEELEPEAFLTKRKEILGSEFLFSGQVRENKFFNNQEFFATDIEKIDIEKLIEQLEKS